LTGELGILLNRFGESQAAQLSVDFNRLHEVILASRAKEEALMRDHDLI